MMNKLWQEDFSNIQDSQTQKKNIGDTLLILDYKDGYFVI